MLVPPTSYVISATAGTGGVYSPGGSVNVAAGQTQVFNITPPNATYQIANVSVDGVPVGAVTKLCLLGVNANHTIAATFSTVTPPGTPSN
ncbi:MAG: hypothetical protein IPM02_28015 [Betaproteobacteria bacterium]|nr:hypothetical protein [Betaproteobacteria bacterium]